jgi:Spy/CpxP family protein refolding chaperone
MKKDTSNESLPRPIRRRLWMTLMMLGIFAGGLVLGSALTVATIVHRVREAIHTPGKTAERIMSRMMKDLDLTDEQASQVRAVVRRNMIELRVQKAKERAQVSGRMKMIRQEMDEILTPEQEQKLNQRFDRLQKLWMPSK